MIIVILKEKQAFEKRVSLTPENVKAYITLGFAVYVEKNAGALAGFLDESYIAQGAVVNEKLPLDKADILLCIHMPSLSTLKLLSKKCFVIGQLDPFNHQPEIRAIIEQKISALSVEFLPRITRAQSMDVLSSQANLAGYRAVIEATHAFTHAFPLMMTAAGTVPAARVLVLGAGVAGLQAIATAKRLGAIVSGYDVRASVKEQIQSLGATFIEVSYEEEGDTKSGYAKEMSAGYQNAQEEKLKEILPKMDIVITTAQIPGKKAPTLITKDMLNVMKPGSVVVDMACSSGGNCTVSEVDKIIEYNNITIVGYTDFASRVGYNASQLYAKNLFNFVKTLFKIDSNTKTIEPDWDDELIQATLLTKNGEVLRSGLTTKPIKKEASSAPPSKPVGKEKSEKKSLVKSAPASSLKKTPQKKGPKV
jgi:NAD(P) transhydrogenase subunit alpha